MRTRVISSVGVVVVGLVPILLGGPVFASLMAAIGIVGLREYLMLADRIAPSGAAVPTPSYVAIALLALAGWLEWPVAAVAAVLFVGAMLPLVLAFRAPSQPGIFAAWALVGAGMVYLGIPVFTGASLRQTQGPVATDWLAGFQPVEGLWEPAPRGLAWVLLVVLAIWVGDSAAYLGGRSFGKRKLAPALSPNKTVEGAVSGLMGSAVVALLASVLLGLDLPAPLALLTGVLIGVVGQVGDLSESLLKRQAGVKDSGNLIPGHGGILDRVDALLFALPVGLLAATVIDGLVR